eukprot:1160687-Pelagomonas_calceolata.AAC.3
MAATCFAAEQEVVERTARGEMDGMNNFRAAHSKQTGNEDDEADCHSNLRCARTESKVNPMYDINGVLGCTCAHGFAIPNYFCNLPRAENYTFYMVRANSGSWHVLELADT